MGVRLILVGVVAGLGLTLPTGPQITSWKGSTQSWVSARLADWDARMPADEKAFIYVADATPVLEDQPDTKPIDDPARATIASPLSTPTPEPIKIASQEVLAVFTPEAFAAGIDTPTSPMGFEDVEFVTTRDNLSVETVSLDLAFVEAQTATLANFAVDATQTIENLAATIPQNSPDAFDGESPDDLQEGSSYLFAAVEVVKCDQAESQGVIASIVPPESADDLYPGVAYSLNRQSEGIDSLLVRRSGREVTIDLALESSARLVEAVKLTREAVYAWANLLHGPAVVTINH